MMADFEEKVLRINVAKKLKWLLIFLLCVLLVGGGLCAVLLRTQIGEAVSYAREWDRIENNPSGIMSEYQKDGQTKEDDFFENLQITPPTTAAKASVAATALLLAFTLLALWILTAVWLYQSAALSGMNRLFWLVFGVLGHVFAVVLFLIVRSFIRKKCPVCGRFQSGTSHYCAHCGAAMHLQCPDCGEYCADEALFCHACGKRLHDLRR